MKKLLIVSNEKQNHFWNNHLDLSEVGYSIYDGDFLTHKMDDFKPDVVLIDEYFHQRRYKDITKKCISEGIKYYILGEEADDSIRKYNLSEDVLTRISTSLETKVLV